MTSATDERPALVGTGPVVCSSSTELSVVPGYIFDVNHYYRDLKVPVTATRKQLRLAYYECDGMSSERLTYVLKQLLNPSVRRAYDLVPLGEIYIDKYVEEMIHRKATIEAYDRMAKARVDATDPENQRDYLSAVFEDMGIPVSFGDAPEEDLDALNSGGQDERAHPAENPFPYAYYTWRCGLRDQQRQMEILAQWQEHLVRAFSRGSHRLRFAVGLQGGTPHPMFRARVGFREVFFIHHLETPNDVLAQRAVAEWQIDNIPSLER